MAAILSRGRRVNKNNGLLSEHMLISLRWRHNDHAGVSNHQPPGCLLNRLFRRKSKKTSKLRVTGLCAGNSPGTGEFSAQMASYAENVSIWWRHHVLGVSCLCPWHSSWHLSSPTSYKASRYICQISRVLCLVGKQVPLEMPWWHVRWFGVMTVMKQEYNS